MADNNVYSPIPARLHSVATEGVVSGADEIFDDAKGKRQSVINQETDAALDNKYDKDETYSKQELNNLITTPNQEYETYNATDQTTDVTDVLPATGEADTVYRVGNWDGSQFDASVYSEYAWNGSAYIKLNTKSQAGEVYDISANHSGAKYADLSAALDGGNNVPVGVRKGGMSVKFVSSSDNKYVQYRLMSDTFSTNEADWQGVDEKPVLGSKNLIDSNATAMLKVKQPSGGFSSDNVNYPNIGAYGLDGVYVINPNRKTTDLFEVTEGAEILCRFVGNGGSVLQVAAFDADKNIILDACVTEYNNINYGVYTVPSGVKYVCFSTPTSTLTMIVDFVDADVHALNNKGASVWECFDLLYEGDIEEVYIPKQTGVKYVYFKSGNPGTGHTNRIILSLRNDANTELCKCQVYDVEPDSNGFLELICTDATDTSLVGKAIGYVKFKNFEHFISNPDSRNTIGRYCMLNYLAATNIKNSPSIISHFVSISDTKTVVSQKVYPKHITANYLNQDTFIDEALLVMPLASNWTSQDNIVIRFASGRVVVNSSHIGRYPDFVGVTYMDSYADGQIIPIHVTTSRNESYPLGTLIGYVIVNDISGASQISDSTNTSNPIIDIDYCYWLKNSPKIAAYLSNLDNVIPVDITLPEKITAVVGDTLQIFYKTIVTCPDYKQYGVVVNCSIGKSYPRYFEVKPVAADIGEKDLTVFVYGNDMKVVNQKTIKLDVIAKAISPAANKNILLVAGSTFAYGIIMPEVKRRFTLTSGSGTAANPTGLGLSNISFIGRKTIETTSDLPEVKQEATGGYGWKTYATDAFKSHRFYVSGVNAVTLGATYTIDGVPIPSGVGYLRVIEVNITDGTGNILCEVNGGAVYPQGSIPASGTLIKRDGTGDASIAYSSTVEEDGNPFWYNNDLDFQHYSSAYCNNADIDILITHIGLNGFTSIANVDTQIETYAKPFIRKYHEDYPNGKVILNTLQIGSPFGGYGSVGYASSTQNWYNISKIYWYALEKYKELAESDEFKSYVVLGSITPEFDCEFGYPTTNKAVNNRVATTEAVQSNQIHPTDDGKLMLADSIYRDITKVLSQF